MYFGNINVKDSVNCILAHTIIINKKKFAKGTIITEIDKSYFINNKIKTIVCARLDKNDLHEDKAANVIAEAFKNNSIASEKAYTGRAKVLANKSGHCSFPLATLIDLTPLDANPSFLHI